MSNKSEKSCPTNLIEEHKFFNRDLQSLKPLDEILRCCICFEYFNICMMTACNHNYCSLCIRKYMQYKAQCPTCFQETSEPQLRNNRLIDEIVLAYKAVRQSCQLFYADYIGSSSQEISNPDVSTAKHLKSETNEVVNIDTDSTADEAHQSTSFESKVNCPVCSVAVLRKNINLHLDSCLLSNEDSSALPSKARRLLLPKVVYHLLSDKELRKKLKDSGLNVAGERQALIRRHKNFLVLYNSECDSLEPKSVPQIIKQLEAEEAAEKRNESQSKVFLFDKKSDPKIIEQQQHKYEKRHSRQFNSLIENIHSRRRAKVIESGAIPSDPDDPDILIKENEASLCSSPEILEERTESGENDFDLGSADADTDGDDTLKENALVATPDGSDDDVIFLDDNMKNPVPSDLSPKDSHSQVFPSTTTISKRQGHNLRKRKIIENSQNQNGPPVDE